MKKKIIFFEDDEFLAEMYKKIMETRGFEVIYYTTPSKDPVSLVLKEKPDLIIMSIIMPEMDGFTATKILKTDKRTKDIPIVGLTSLSQPKDIKLGKDLGMADYFVKSFITPNEFINKIKKYLD